MSDGFLSLGDYQKTAENYWQAAEIADEISFLPIQHLSHVGLANINLFQNNLGEARTAIEVALQYDMPQFNQNATALQGIIALRQEEIETAKKAFTRSIAQANKILSATPDYENALDTKGLASCGLAVCLESENKSQSAQAINDAIISFQAARKVSCEAGVVKSVLQQFDALAESDNKGILKEVRKAITGNK
jgi:tetratricopeptide (TPR) repeat protein